MRIRTILNILIIILISSIAAAQNTITFDDLGWSSDQVLDSTFTISNFKVSSSQKFCTNYGCNFDVNSVSIYFVFQDKTDQITITALNNLLIDLNSFDVYQVSEQSTDTLVIEGWIDAVKKYSKSFSNDTTWKTLTLNYKDINKLVVKLNPSGSGGISDYNFDNFSFSPSPTPVELVEFKANAESNLIELQWKTATELNNYGFEVERSQKSEVSSQSRSGTSNTQWQRIGFVKGNGTSTIPNTYSFRDNKAQNGYKYKYRLKQIDINGGYNYSSTIEVTASLAPAAYSLSQNYPNPFNPSTTINFSIPKEGMVALKVYDILGNAVATLVDGEKDAGHYSVKFSPENLSSGIYIYELKVSPSTGSGQSLASSGEPSSGSEYNFISRNKMMFLK